MHLEQFVRNRITQLRLQKGVSEYQMSYDLGRSRGYINNISSGKSLPSMSEFLSICEYFNISPKNFFDDKLEYPALITKLQDKVSSLQSSDLLFLINLIDRFSE